MADACAAMGRLEIAHALRMDANRLSDSRTAVTSSPMQASTEGGDDAIVASRTEDA